MTIADETPRAPELTDFDGRTGQPFIVRFDAHDATLELTEVMLLPRNPTRPTDPFLLHFLGPLEPLLRQAVHRLTHAELGDLDIFLVPIARDDRGVIYEAVFN